MISTDYREKIKEFWIKGLKLKEVNGIKTYIKISKDIGENTCQIMFFKDFRILTIPAGIEEIPVQLRKAVSQSFDEKKLDETIKNIEEKRYIMYLSPEAYKLIEVEGAELKKLSESDRTAFNDLKARTSEKDNETSFVEMDHPVVFGCLFDNKLVAVSSNLNWGEYIADIGILTDSNYRKKGFGKATVNALCAWNIEQGKINQYRCEAENVNSFRIARNLGFELTALVYRFKTEVAKNTVEKNKRRDG